MFVSSYLEGRLDNKILCAYIDCDVFVHNQAVIMEVLSFDLDYIVYTRVNPFSSFNEFYYI